jgi:hypothetical protein
MDLRQLAARLDALARDRQQAQRQQTEPLDQQLRRLMEQRSHVPGYTHERFQQDMAALQAKHLALVQQPRSGLADLPGGPLYALLDELCPAYEAAEAPTRAAIRDAVAARRGMPDRVLSYAQSLAGQVRSAADEPLLHRALVAVSIENHAVDYRDSLLATADMYVRAERSGIDPRPYFAYAADLSDTATPLGGPTPVAQVLRDFPGYAVLAERRGRP